MTKVEGLTELNLPIKHIGFLKEALEALTTDNRVKSIILFGSCARGDVKATSDIDLLVTTKENIGIDAELEFYDYLPDVYNNLYIPCDLIVMSDELFRNNIDVDFVVQKYINIEGVTLYESL